MSEILTFHSLEEIRRLPGFKDDNGVNDANYDSIYADYSIPKEEAKCCYLKPNGNLCGEDHKIGWVVKLKDRSLTIIGNVCARLRFGAESKLRADARRHSNEKRRSEQLALLQQLLDEKDATLSTLRGLMTEARKVEARADSFLDSLGEDTARRLREKVRVRNAEVSVDAVTYKEYIDEEGERQTERRVSPTRLGSLNGLSILNEHSFSSIYSRDREIRAAYANAEAFAATGDVKTSQLEAVTAAIGGAGTIEAAVRKLEHDAEQFFRPENLRLLCFLVDDKVERYKTARVVLEHAGEPASKDRAKAWLAALDQELKQGLKANKLEARL